MRGWKILGLVAVLIIGGGIVFAALAWRSEIPATDIVQKFDAAMVNRGAELAAAGNCIACHTVPGTNAFAGGVALPTPVGALYSNNITPDPETGIGRWSEAAFKRAMREGVDREGEHLYPAFPYDHFTHVADEGIGALYAFLMTREPVKASPPANELRFPFGFRPLLAVWKLLYLDVGPSRLDPRQSEEWNRGAYLAEGLGHCGACHTPRNRLGAEDKDRHFAGGEAEGWVAYAINEASPAPTPWTKEALAFFLRHGFHVQHGVSRGPMAEVTGNLAGLPESDVNAIAAYVISQMDKQGVEKGTDAKVEPASDKSGASGEEIYKAACATCHESGRPPPFGALDFHLSTAVNAPNPQNIINVTLFGIPPADGEASAVMPGFAAAFSDQQIADLLAYMRRSFSNGPAWPNVAEMTGRTRSGEYKVAIRPADGIERAPQNVGAKE
jgi:mono/diheme cytochrome c family protein